MKLETWDQLLEAIAKGERCSGIAKDSRLTQLPVVGICEPDRAVRVLVNDRREDVPFDAPSWTWLSHGSLVNVPYMNKSSRGAGRTLRMCQVANVAAERGESVMVIAQGKELGMLRQEPYCLSEAIYLHGMNSPAAQLFFDHGRVEVSWRGLVLVDHWCWDRMRRINDPTDRFLRDARNAAEPWRPAYARSIEDQMGVNAPYVPPDWPGMPKGDDWLVVADYWADNGDPKNAELARNHHSRIHAQR